MSATALRLVPNPGVPQLPSQTLEFWSGDSITYHGETGQLQARISSYPDFEAVSWTVGIRCEGLKAAKFVHIKSSWCDSAEQAQDKIKTCWKILLENSK